MKGKKSLNKAREGLEINLWDQISANSETCKRSFEQKRLRRTI